MSLGGSSSLSDESLGPSSPLPPTGLEGSTFPRLFAALLAYLGNNLVSLAPLLSRPAVQKYRC